MASLRSMGGAANTSIAWSALPPTASSPLYPRPAPPRTPRSLPVFPPAVSARPTVRPPPDPPRAPSPTPGPQCLADRRLCPPSAPTRKSPLPEDPRFHAVALARQPPPSCSQPLIRLLTPGPPRRHAYSPPRAEPHMPPRRVSGSRRCSSLRAFPRPHQTAAAAPSTPGRPGPAPPAARRTPPGPPPARLSLKGSAPHPLSAAAFWRSAGRQT
ncbi:unnamed protein product [Dicrocoelium dendriticum]|nr:unnamed protein product [Dicrocoelium dendriticum]